MTKKRVFAGIALLAFVWATVSMFRADNALFAALFAILYATFAVSLFLPNVKLLQVIPLVLLVVLGLLCIVPWSYKIATNLNLNSGYWQYPSWWNEWKIQSLYNPYAFDPFDVPFTLKGFFGWLGFGTMQWLHLDCISAILGVVALILTLVSALLKDTMASMKSTLTIVMMALLITSGFSAMLCIAYFFAFCSILEA